MLASTVIDRNSLIEADLRRDLAACYRLVALSGWDDLVGTHISVRLPGDDTFLINPFGMLFDELRPADLVKVDMQGKIVSPTNWGVNLAGFVIHSAVHAVRHDAACVMHLHTQDGIAVSMLEEGLLPLNQTSMVLDGDIAYHDYEGVAFSMDERERLVADLGKKNLMILRNHGTLALGATIAEAFTYMHFLETACSIQVRALGMGRKLRPVDPEIVARAVNARQSVGRRYACDLVWPAMLRKLDRVDPTWRG